MRIRRERKKINISDIGELRKGDVVLFSPVGRVIYLGNPLLGRTGLVDSGRMIFIQILYSQGEVEKVRELGFEKQALSIDSRRRLTYDKTFGYTERILPKNKYPHLKEIKRGGK